MVRIAYSITSTHSHNLSMTPVRNEHVALQNEIIDLEKKLADAKARQRASIASDRPNGTKLVDTPSSSLHTLLLLADSALPLGSFAFSSGLESFLAHKKLIGNEGKSQQALFRTFLSLSLQSLASTALPYVLETYREPWRLIELDNDFDASTPCTVARRASVAQGKALLTVWERSFKLHSQHRDFDGKSDDHDITDVSATNRSASILVAFSTALRTSSRNELPVNGHLAPLWGAITMLLGIDVRSSAYLFIFSHARTVVSAAVRASVLGPYQAQAVLAGVDLQKQIDALVERYWDRTSGGAGQSVPVMDLWVGRHEKLYSRIFNS